MNTDGQILAWIMLLITILILQKISVLNSLNSYDQYLTCYIATVVVIFWIGICNKNLNLIELSHKFFSLFLIIGPLFISTPFSAYFYILLSIIMFISWNYNPKGCIWSNTAFTEEDKPKHLFRGGVFGKYYIVEIYCLIMCILIITRMGLLEENTKKMKFKV